MKKIKKKIMKLIAFALVLALAVPTMSANAAVAAKLNATKATITGVGTKYVLTLTAPSGSKSAWTSSKSSVASVNGNGIVTAKKIGSAIITCTVKYGKQTKKLNCTITVKVPAKAVEFTNAIIDKEYSAHILEIGTPYDFNAKLISTSTKSASSDIRRFYVSDSTVATVNVKTGVVTPLKAGTTQLTVCAGATEAAALSKDNTIINTIYLKVVAPTVSISSCSLDSGKVLAIRFSKPMNGSTLFDSSKKLTSNVSITPRTVNSVTAADLGTLTASLSTDLQTLYIQSTNAFNGNYAVDLSSSILSSTGIALKPYSNVLALTDTIKPSFNGYTTDETGLVANIKFSEPIDITNMVATDPRKSDNSIPVSSAIFTTKSNYKLSEDKTTISIDLSSISTSDKNVEISVKLAGIVDLAGNTTDPYPCTVWMKTDTSTQAQASCQSVIRNGNSLVATFSRSIQTPGYAYINGVFVTGTINASNKKEVIYNLATSGLSSLTGSIAVTLNGFVAYNAPTSPVTQFSTTVSFTSTTILPSITATSLTTKTINNVKQQVLTLTYDKNITLKSTSGTLSATSNVDGVIGAATSYAYTASVTDNAITIILTGTFVELGTYTFTIPAGFVTDVYNNSSIQTTISVVKLSGDTTVLPAPVSIQLDNASTNTIYVTFNNMLDPDSAQNVSNYTISGLTVASATLIANSPGSPSIVQLKLATGSTVADIPYQVSISGIKGYKNSYSVMNTYTDMLTISSNKTLTLTCLGTAATKKILVTSTSTISGSSTINYTFTCSGKTLTLSSSPVISGSTITFEFTDTITAGSVVTMQPATNNSIVNASNQKALNQPYSVTMN